ncbi:hypothetical protein L596_014778 [Steinernema carpocapsae]|uniref:G-protein coupled receptors family 1 profile domain-containing protein n=1 Tax=Steinernema carpocapsae TaxID=34508 RepID=A0A4U5NDG4_STECR|nr:hypothetical protein L596_014778 [Steinernema carpocapsae]
MRRLSEMLLLWTTFFTVVLSLFVFVFNVVLLFAIATTPKLHTFSNALASNLWIANTMSAAVTLFQNLLTSSVSTSSTSSYVTELGPQTLVALFNSTVSLLALLAMASVQIMARYQTWLPRSAPMRISVSIWVVVVITVFVNFALMQITKSFALIIAFQLALLSIFLVINLILHPINLLLASRVNQDPQLSKSITQSLWLLLHSLSFTLLAMMLVWESSNSQQQPNFAKESQASSIENIQLLSLQLAAYSVHCIANPLITVIRDPHLAHAIGRIIYGKGSRSELDYSYSLCQAHESVPYVYLPEHWLLGHIPPPPPYMSQSNSIIVEQAEVI